MEGEYNGAESPVSLLASRLPITRGVLLRKPNEDGFGGSDFGLGDVPEICDKHIFDTKSSVASGGRIQSFKLTSECMIY